jgi:hypothetical protein
MTTNQVAETELGAFQKEYVRSWRNRLWTLARAVLGLACWLFLCLWIFVDEEHLGVWPRFAGLFLFGAILYGTDWLLLVRMAFESYRSVRIYDRGLLIDSPRGNRPYRWEEIRAVTWSSLPFPPIALGRILSWFYASPWCALELTGGGTLIFSDVSLRGSDLRDLVTTVQQHTTARAEPPKWTIC